MSHLLFKRIETPPFELEFHGNKDFATGHSPFSEPAIALILAASPQNITQLNSGGFFRFYPDAKESAEEERVSDVEVILSESLIHFNKLQEIGIRVPRFDSVVGKAPDRNKIAIYSLSERIIGKELDAFPIHGDQDILHSLALKLYAYYEWVIFNDIPYCLSDITLLRQYIYGRPSRNVDQNQEDGIYLVDIEPRIINNQIPASRNRISYELWCLRGWAENIRPTRTKMRDKELLLSKIDVLKLMVNAQAGIQ